MSSDLMSAIGFLQKGEDGRATLRAWNGATRYRAGPFAGTWQKARRVLLPLPIRRRFALSSLTDILVSEPNNEPSVKKRQSMVKIVNSRARDIRFPTSQHADGSDAMNLDPDYSAAYVVLETDQPGLEGHGLNFTLGKGNWLYIAAIGAVLPIVLGRDLTEITADMA